MDPVIPFLDIDPEKTTILKTDALYIMTKWALSQGCKDLQYSQINHVNVIM